MYTTVKGNQIELTPSNWKNIKRCAAKRLGEWDKFCQCPSALFEACWREYRKLLTGTDAPTCIDDVTGWIESLISARVNNSRSKFYMHG